VRRIAEDRMTLGDRSKKSEKRSATRRRMVCGECGVAMNLHAEKPLQPAGRREAGRVDPVLGGIIEEHHTCPECGKGHVRAG
jgi:ribosomal protein S27AE